MCDRLPNSSPILDVEVSTTREGGGRLELAAEAYRRFRSRCFWHCPPDLKITEELIPFVVKGLRTHGGREGFQLAGRLR